VPGKELSFVAVGFTVFAALAMVSNIRYFSFKQFNVKERAPFMGVIAVVLIFVLISLDPPQVLFMIFLVYSVSGPLGAVVNAMRRRNARRQTPERRT